MGGPCPGLRPTLAALAGLFHLPIYREYALAAVGAPLEVPRLPQPSPQDVARYHQLYVQRLQQLFEEHKEACGVAPSTHLTIV
ncbi:2-acylglycerol O-acyltransferase 3 [Grus japonensis]|uniref:2-acylglycerol O-acyltransferase 3 n=1 Tax=Grus japonensis TaxID=30415 RepID=A0ABC9XV57_GRUJA